MPFQTEELLDVLPPPTAWGELAKAITNRPAAADEKDQFRESGLKLLAATLLGDAGLQNQVFKDLAAKAKAADESDRYQYQSFLETANQWLISHADKPETIVQNLEKLLAGGNRRYGYQQVPNLVALIGPEKTEVFLRRALLTPELKLSFNSDNQTHRLAQKLALELVDQMQQPCWNLVDNLEATDLYEALDKKFGRPASPAATGKTDPNDVDLTLPDLDRDSAKEHARIYYLMGLIAHDRIKEATALASQWSGKDNDYEYDQAMEAMFRAGYAVALDDFLHELLAQRPALPFWDQYVTAAAQAGKTDRLLSTIRETLARSDLKAANKHKLEALLYRALLAADQPEAAVTEIQALIHSHSGAQPEAAIRETLSDGKLAMLEARLGLLLAKPAWTTDGLAQAQAWCQLKLTATDRAGRDREEVVVDLAQVLASVGRGPEAESILVEALASHLRTNQNSEAMESSPDDQPILATMAGIYHQAGRPQDVLELLERAEGWNAKDLSELFSLSAVNNGIGLNFLHTGVSSQPVPWLAGDALNAVGRSHEARMIAEALLDADPGLDRGYELLLALDGTNAIPKLDALFARDPFEERPLIWKAHLLREQNQLAEAEKLLRQAIAIDPSDGEEGRGDRMRVYAELAEVRAALSDAKEATFFREVVAAIRMSEQADQFYAIGLLKRAVTMYGESLKHFSDAYCIQSRLAIQLADLGMNEAAEEHYRKAYELMPDSFGRVETHCFGCERAFAGAKAQSIAEKVFTKLVVERPDKPQVHYLLGYLRMEEERYNEAATNFMAAARLDPDYLNAWIHLASVADNTLLEASTRDDIAFNILRLDPAGRHGYQKYESITNVARLWLELVKAND
ncbi:MAG TPA: hypothetical protein VF607_11590, partial [Verrucomicrobiae bacterium]